MLNFLQKRRILLNFSLFCKISAEIFAFGENFTQMPKKLGAVRPSKPPPSQDTPVHRTSRVFRKQTEWVFWLIIDS
jgi:hypothetical protein